MAAQAVQAAIEEALSSLTSVPAPPSPTPTAAPVRASRHPMRSSSPPPENTSPAMQRLAALGVRYPWVSALSAPLLQLLSCEIALSRHLYMQIPPSTSLPQKSHDRSQVGARIHSQARSSSSTWLGEDTIDAEDTAFSAAYWARSLQAAQYELQEVALFTSAKVDRSTSSGEDESPFGLFSQYLLRLSEYTRERMHFLAVLHALEPNPASSAQEERWQEQRASLTEMRATLRAVQSGVPQRNSPQLRILCTRASVEASLLCLLCQAHEQMRSSASIVTLLVSLHEAHGLLSSPALPSSTSLFALTHAAVAMKAGVLLHNLFLRTVLRPPPLPALPDPEWQGGDTSPAATPHSSSASPNPSVNAAADSDPSHVASSGKQNASLVNSSPSAPTLPPTGAVPTQPRLSAGVPSPPSQASLQNGQATLSTTKSSMFRLLSSVMATVGASNLCLVLDVRAAFEHSHRVMEFVRGFSLTPPLDTLRTSDDDGRPRRDSNTSDRTEDSDFDGDRNDPHACPLSGLQSFPCLFSLPISVQPPADHWPNVVSLLCDSKYRLNHRNRHVLFFDRRARCTYFAVAVDPYVSLTCLFIGKDRSHDPQLPAQLTRLAQRLRLERAWKRMKG